MALKITLKPPEKFILGGAVIAKRRCQDTFVVENDVPILREKDIMTLSSADTPCRNIFYVQLMYIDERNLSEHHKAYWELVKDVAEAAPSVRPMLKESARTY